MWSACQRLRDLIAFAEKRGTQGTRTVGVVLAEGLWWTLVVHAVSTKRSHVVLASFLAHGKSETATVDLVPDFRFSDPNEKT